MSKMKLLISICIDLYPLDNEYHDINQTIVLNINQAAINAIRAAGATSEYIFVKGNGYSGAWSWTTTNDNLMKDGFLFIETVHSYNPESL